MDGCMLSSLSKRVTLRRNRVKKAQCNFKDELNDICRKHAPDFDSEHTFDNLNKICVKLILQKE